MTPFSTSPFTNGELSATPTTQELGPFPSSTIGETSERSGQCLVFQRKQPADEGSRQSRRPTQSIILDSAGFVAAGLRVAARVVHLAVGLSVTKLRTGSAGGLETMMGLDQDDAESVKAFDLPSTRALAVTMLLSVEEMSPDRVIKADDALISAKTTHQFSINGSSKSRKGQSIKRAEIPKDGALRFPKLDQVRT
ncbi:hypothetical protein LA080_000474 [Diaporthe eres]|nr:hypothetical protein LA080_000474 [Diaporthe eres]